MESAKFYSEISGRFGNIKRARNCFLYSEKGVRLTDLYAEAGRAILGWGGDSAFTMLKNTLNRGITGSYNTDFDCRLEKAVSQLLNSKRNIKVFYEKEQAAAYASDCSCVPVFYRPWSPEGTDWSCEKAVIFEPALPWTEGIYIAAVLEGEKTAEAKNCKKLAAPVAAAATRSVYNLIKALQEREEKDWFIYDQVVTEYWTRKGPYLFPKMKESDYDAFVLHCLECGLVISPDYNVPSVVPFGADKGVFSKLKNAPFDFSC